MAELESSTSFTFLFDSGSRKGRFFGRIFTIAFGFSEILDVGGGKDMFSKSNESYPILGNICHPKAELCPGKDFRGGSLIRKWAKFASHIRSRTLTFSIWRSSQKCFLRSLMI